jgi:hypothetical protein
MRGALSQMARPRIQKRWRRIEMSRRRFDEPSLAFKIRTNTFRFLTQGKTSELASRT